MRAFLTELKILKDILMMFGIDSSMRPNKYIGAINEFKAVLLWDTSSWIIDIHTEMDMFNSVFWCLKATDCDILIFNQDSDQDYNRIDNWNSVPVTLENYNLEDITIVIICHNGNISLACRALRPRRV